ncbi:MAG: DUF2911 domain-containing protein [Vicinamibacterales bacterium]|nr:DUF2911 domain-containing protein [Vicinamibacterales bacterium]
MTIRGMAVCVLTLALAGAAGSIAHAQERQRASPHETVTAEIDGATISITYGRPYMKGRQVAGGLIPYDKVWRTGADEATTLQTSRDLMFGPAHVSAGSVTLWTLASQTGPWKLILNKQTGQWGTAYDEKQDLSRVDMRVETLPAAVEQFTIAIEKNPAGKGGMLVMTWDTVKMTVPFSVM